MDLPVSETRKLVREGVAIVISILLAFSIDAWWDSRQDHVEERELLAALHEDFLANRAEARGAIAVHEQGGRLMTAAHARTDAETASLSPDSVSLTLSALATPRTFDAVTGTLDAMIGSGRMELIRDAELRRALVVFLNMVADSDEDARYMAEGSRRVWDLQIRHGGPWGGPSAAESVEDCAAPIPPSSCLIDKSELAYFPEPTPSALQAVLHDVTLMGQVRQLRKGILRYVAEVRRIEGQVDLVLQLLERNLS